MPADEDRRCHFEIEKGQLSYFLRHKQAEPRMRRSGFDLILGKASRPEGAIRSDFGLPTGRRAFFLS
jgi:hypothetical protein